MGHPVLHKLTPSNYSMQTLMLWSGKSKWNTIRNATPPTCTF